ncbi:MAG: hypothetical protein MUD12_07280 [Spirochaetes bacterium]|jgi:hypothetical protein|nr:hypothetical protein [Spirochaetota bacterium]
MLKHLPLYLKFAVAASAASAVIVAYPRDKGLRDSLIDFAEKNRVREDVELILDPADQYLYRTGEEERDAVLYRKGDWDRFIISPRYRVSEKDDKLTVITPQDDDININAYGSLKVDLLYGKTMYTSKKYQLFDQDKPESKVIKDGFQPKQDFQLHVEGKVGERMTVYIDHDSKKKDNVYKVKYKAINDDEVIREINAGEIDIKFNHSKYAVYDNNTAKALGVDLTLKKGGLQVKAFGSILKGETEVEVFKGNSAPGTIKLSEYQYQKRTYYQVEPFKRYDNLKAAPSGPSAYNLITLTSAPLDPASYTPYSVNLNPVTFELYIDDQNPTNDYNAITLEMDGGHYNKLQPGVDFSINFTTGLVTFLKDVPEKSRIFAVYNVMDGITSDPCALRPGDPKHPGGMFAGKIFVFIKYGYIIDEDTVVRNLVFDPGEIDKNNDGKVNLDIYEVRSFYFVGAQQILADNLNVVFYKEKGIMVRNEVSALGKYSMNYAKGIIQFNLREPYRQILQAGIRNRIYAETQPSNVYDYSRYRIRVDYYKDARSFQLKYTNILPGSVKIRLNGRDVQQSLYTVDYTSGYLRFNDPNNPVIGPEAVVEIRYEYSPFITQSESFVGGIRTDYALNRNINLGTSFLYSRSANKEVIPRMGEEPTQTMLFEGDIKLNLRESDISQFANYFSKNKTMTVPLEFSSYAEYARSYKNINTFGKGLVDNMEDADDSMHISLSDKDWILASRPNWLGVANRSVLNYYYYRDPNNPSSLQGIFYPGLKIPYSVKAGPFNIAFGHVLDQMLKQSSQTSLVFDFEANGEFASVATRKIGEKAVDFTGLQYLEVSYFYSGTGDVNLYVDLGKINEDSDGDGNLDTEDLNRNGVLDADTRVGFSEDIGYEFNDPMNPTRVGGGPNLNHITRGDGVLETEDLNGNGVLDTQEGTYQFPAILIRAADVGWQTKRIYLDQTSLTQTQLNILTQVEALRLTVQNSARKGRIYFDKLRFVTTKWKEISMDGLPGSPTNMKVSLIDSLNDLEYSPESFLFIRKKLYESMYGEKKLSEYIKEKETALKIEYSIPGANSYVSATRRFSRPMDIRFYKTMNLWFNYRNFSQGDIVGVVLGSSDTDFVEYKFPMDFRGVWREVKLILKKGSGGEVIPAGFSGIPDYKRIVYIKLKVYGPGHAGTLWLDELYASEPEVVQDSAHWFEGEIRTTRPIFHTDNGTPVFSDINLKYIQKGHGKQFSSVGKKDQDIAEEYKEAFTSAKILPNWNMSMDFIREDSKTDSLNEEVVANRRGKTKSNSFNFVSDYMSNMNAVPSVKLNYKYDTYDNDLNETISSIQFNKRTLRYIHSPVVNITENVENFLWGHFSANMAMNMVFKDEDINRSSQATDIESLYNITPLREREKRQKSELQFSLNYRHASFYMQPSIAVGSEELVEWIGKNQVTRTDVLYEVKGEFHFPFVYKNNYKFVDRNKKWGYIFGLSHFQYITPEYKLEMQYYENRFRDYELSEAPIYEFQREKDARSMVTTQFNVPINLYRIKELKFVKSFNILYQRSVFLQEMNIPYEGEKKYYTDEKYGINRSLKGISNGGSNIFKYYPFYYYMGRGNFANARDYTYKKLNRQIAFSNGTIVQDYNNQLKVIENFTLNSTYDLDKLSLDVGGGLNQVCERQNINGIPEQIVTRDLGFKLTFDLMKIFSFSFFRPNTPDKAYHSSFFDIGYKFVNNLHITSSFEENIHNPTFGLTFKRNRASLAFKYGIEVRDKFTKSYIWNKNTDKSFRDWVYVDNMKNTTLYKEKDKSHTFSAVYETDVVWIHTFFSRFYKLVAYPIFSLEYSLLLNRYFYLTSTSPEPYDLHLFKSKLSLDLHKNIQGGFTTRLAIEKFRNRVNMHVSKELLSYEFGLNFTLLF